MFSYRAKSDNNPVAATTVCLSSTILIVETPPVRNLIGTVLEKERYTVLLEDTAGALEALRRGDRKIDLLITNEPWHFEPYRAGMRILYISGAPDREFLRERQSEVFGYLQKPFRFHELLLRVKDLLPADSFQRSAFSDQLKKTCSSGSD